MIWCAELINCNHTFLSKVSLKFSEGWADAYSKMVSAAEIALETHSYDNAAVNYPSSSGCSGCC